MPSEPAAYPSERAGHAGLRRIPALAGLLALLSVLLTLDHPGLTVDEPLDVAPGREYLRLLAKSPGRFLSPAVIDATYANNKEHPPLGRWLLGLASTLFEPIEAQLRGPDPTERYVRAARVAPALAFALLVLVVVRWSGRTAGPVAAVGTGLSLLTMPRVFGHAHLAALDTFVALTWTSAYLAALDASEARRLLPALRAGLLTGLALLTKIHGWLLFPMLALLLLRCPGWRPKANLALAALLAVTLFFVGWPWLWNDPAGRLAAYFRTGLERIPIRVLYFGTVYRDVDVPWHYPWFYTIATVPLGTLVLGALGAGAALRPTEHQPRPRAFLLAIVLWLALFSTNLPVYDGERLFLPVFPLLAVLAGRGLALAWNTVRGTWGRALLAGAVVAQGYGLFSIHPFELSYYNALMGGLRGAERMGLELTYWGDAVDDRLLDELARRAAPGALVARVPTLSPSQGLFATTRALMRRDLHMNDQEERGRAAWLVIDRRTAYWPDDVAALVRQQAPAAVRRRQGVWLSGLWKGPAGKTAEPN
jgi:4-amino-4-deoxy-L-arabinose transferase-like glycosyltransferase